MLKRTLQLLTLFIYLSAGSVLAASNDFDVSSWLVATTESPAGWDNPDGWSDPGFGYYVNGTASVISPFLERWHDRSWGGLADTQLSQTISHLPAGSYTVQADIIAVLQGSSASQYGTPATGVSLFAGGSQTACSTGSERPKTYTVNTDVTADGQLIIGMRCTGTNANWVACDNFVLTFHGTREELMDGERQKVRIELSEYYTDAEIDALMAEAGDDFEALEQLRKSVAMLPRLDPLAHAARNLTIGGQAPVYVESLGLYLCTIPLINFDTDLTARISYTPAEGCGELHIDGIAVAPGTDHVFSGVQGGREYIFSLTDATGSTINRPVTFTSLPVVRLYGSFSNAYQPGTIMVHEPDKDAPQPLAMKAKWRGGITNSSGKHKRNYHVKLLTADGGKIDQKFFGLRNDNSWILEACQVDMSRIRNRVLTDLWNDFATAPYYADQEPKARSGTRGRFVELVLNDEYRGIYCMTENMDRKQMKLKKHDEDDGTVHGQLWKSKDWSYGVFMGHDPDNSYYPKRHPSNYSDWSSYWESYNVKYPDLNDVSPTDWSALYDAVDFVCTSTDANFRQHIGEYFDLPVVIDYYILMETILSTDNHGKNMFFAVYDRQQSGQVTLGVWDMDATCGQRWSDDYWHQSFLGPEQDYAQFITRYEHGDYNLFRRLRNTDADDFNMRVRLRYRDLRQTWLGTESILDRFRTQLGEFKTCGADQREYSRWSYDTDVARRKLDFDGELAYIENWFTRRMNYLDERRFKIAELPDAIWSVGIGQSETAQDVFNLRGQKVGTADAIDRLPAGIYIIGGRKLFIK